MVRKCVRCKVVYDDTGQSIFCRSCREFLADLKEEERRAKEEKRKEREIEFDEEEVAGEYRWDRDAT